jgi:predicted phosphoribosyltransferase
MRTLLLGLLAIATGVTATADTVVVHTMGAPHHPVLHPTVITDSGYRFLRSFLPRSIQQSDRPKRLHDAGHRRLAVQ